MKKQRLRVALFICALAALLTVFAAAFNTIEYRIGDSYINFDTETGTILTGGYELTELDIPSEIQGVSVTAIQDRAFYHHEDLTAVTIPDSMTTIGVYSFTGTGLTEIVIPDSVTSIGTWSFMDCENLASVTLGSGLTSITDCMFESCHSLRAVAIPGNVASIGSTAFSRCTGLTELTIENGVVSIGENAFANCTGLTEVVLPDSVTTLDWSAFSHCSGLTTVTIGKNVTSIGTFAFSECTNLTDVYYGGTEAQWDEIEIGYDNDYLKNANIHYSGTGGSASGSVFTPAAPTAPGGAALTAANLGNLTSVTVPVQYSGETARTVSVAVAFYDGNGLFAGFGVASASVNSGSNEVTVPIGGVTGAALMKALVMDAGLAPLCGAGTYPIPAA